MTPTDLRFAVPPRDGSGCDSCKHSTFKHHAVACWHPERPPENREVVRWFRGCPQHTDKE